MLGTAEALIPKSCQEELDYERLETLGDACLKYSASLHLFNAFPAAHEGTPPSLQTCIAGCVDSGSPTGIRHGLESACSTYLLSLQVLTTLLPGRAL